MSRGLLVVALVFSQSCASAFWFEKGSVSWHVVDPDYSWHNRRTGIVTDWTAGLAVWDHYNATALSNSHPIPWTSGRMLKFLRLLENPPNGSAFELRSVYEPSATGLWLEGYMDERPDHLMTHGYVFSQTPFRVTHLPVEHFPPQLEAAASASRATIVQPTRATFSGPRWLPTVQQVEELPKDATRWHSFELWLGQPTEVVPEGRKMGLFVEYNGVTGELKQVFRMKEVQLPSNLAPDSPLQPLRLDAISLLARKFAPWTNHRHLESSAAQALLEADRPISEIIENPNWKKYVSRVVRTEAPHIDGEVCAELESSNSEDWQSQLLPSDSSPEQYFDCRFPDGMYCRIPKSMAVEALDNETPVCFEFGGISQEGYFHRLVAMGSRIEGGLSTALYERLETGPIR